MIDIDELIRDTRYQCTRNENRIIMEEWFYKDQPHRVAGPARIHYYLSGAVHVECWMIHGWRHRKDGPAMTAYYPDGQIHSQEWNEEGRIHRLDGPAHLTYSPKGELTDEVWYYRGSEHCRTAPARRERIPAPYSSWSRKWYLFGVELKKDSYNYYNQFDDETAMYQLALLTKDYLHFAELLQPINPVLSKNLRIASEIL